MNRLGLVALAAVIATAAGGCGRTTAVRGNPVPAAAGITTRTSAAPRPSLRPSAPPRTTTSTTTTSSTPPATPDGPAAVVQAYFDAINAHDYQRAWTLGGKNIGQSYATFASGFATTDHDVLTIESTEGNAVTANLTAVQTDGTQRTYRGTYTVTDGVITHFSVRPT